MMLVLRVTLRVPILAAAVIVALFAIAGRGGGLVGPSLGALNGALAVLVLTRYGLVAVVAYFVISRAEVLLRVGLAWDGGTAVLVIVVLVAFVAAAAWVAMGSPRLAGAPARTGK